MNCEGREREGDARQLGGKKLLGAEALREKSVVASLKGKDPSTLTPLNFLLQ